MGLWCFVGVEGYTQAPSGAVAERLNALDSKSSMEVSFIGGSNPPCSVIRKGIRNGVPQKAPFRPFWSELRGSARLRDFPL